MNTSEMVGVLGAFLVIAGLIAGAIGWVLNLVAIAHTVSDPLTGMFVLRCIGVIFAPIGAVLGYVP